MLLASTYVNPPLLGTFLGNLVRSIGHCTEDTMFNTSLIHCISLEHLHALLLRQLWNYQLPWVKQARRACRRRREM